jgi:hypothetical protein
VRLFLAGALVSALVIAAAAWRDAPPPPPPPPASRTAVHQQLKDCRDQCEQTAIVEQLPEWRMVACRAACEERHPLPPAKREPIRRITVAPADHTRTLRDEK